MSAQPTEDVAAAPSGWTIDELAALVGSTVRTIRYYATLGLIPPPERRGRMAFYDVRHRARLDLVRTMQEQGLTLSSIEQHLSHLDPEAPPEEIEMRRALISSWAPVPPARLHRDELVRRAGRPITDEEVETLERIGALRRVDGDYEAVSTLEVGLGLLDLDIPVESMEEAGAAIRRHMDALALELRDIMRVRVLAPMRERHALDSDPAAFAETMTRLRQLTLDAVVSSFQQAANGLADGSLLAYAETPAKEK